MSDHQIQDGVSVMVVDLGDNEGTVIDSCRICLQNAIPACSLAAVVMDGDMGAAVTLQELLSQVCAIELDSDARLPFVLCVSCRETLLAAYKLQLLVHQSEALLLEQLASLHENDSSGLLNRPLQMPREPILYLDEQQGEVPELTESVSPPPAAEKQLHPCGSCDKQFPKAEQLSRHEAMMHQVDPERPFKCPVCQQSFHIESTMKLHMTVHEPGDMPLSVKVEGREGDEEESFVDLEHGGGGGAGSAGDEGDEGEILIFQCSMCDSEYDTQEAFDAHWTEHEEEVEGAPDTTTTAARLRTTVRKKVYECPHCPKVYKSLNLMASHTRTFHEAKPLYACDVCGREFPLPSYMEEHKRTHDKPYACDQCEKRFHLASGLRSHIKTHATSRPFICTLCRKAFVSMDALREHEMRHATSEKRFSCDQCPSKFSTKATLHTHRRIHTGEKPYKCAECPAAFNTHFSWSKHKRTHSGERPYVCEICGMGFNSSYHLTVSRRRRRKRNYYGVYSKPFFVHFQRHTRIHTGEKPYKCDFCPRAFTQSNDLVKHKRSHMGKNTYRCTECPESFRLYSELKQHLTKHFLENKSKGGAEMGSGEMVFQEEVEIE